MVVVTDVRDRDSTKWTMKRMKRKQKEKGK